MAFQGLFTAFAGFVFATSGGADDRQVGTTDVISASNSFSQNLYREVAKPGQNLVYSPYSIHSALTMTSVGARGSTLQEMKTVLGLTGSKADIGTRYRDLITKLNSAIQVNLTTTNAIFANPTQTLNDKFVDEIGSNYDAMATTFDLSDPKGPEAKVNDYISTKTNHLINNVLSKGSIDSKTLMVLINTIYFHGIWEDTFDQRWTEERDFSKDLSTTTKVNMMQRTGSVKHKKDLTRKVEVVELPFRGNQFALYIALPTEVEGITELEATLAKGVDDLFQHLVEKDMELAIPKFKIETSLQLKENLQAMGMPTAFKCGTADFSGMAMSANGKFCISSVIHKAVIDVMETGTVAAAVTAVIVAEKALLTPPSFTADHPFVYFLRDKRTVTGQILFQGKFTG